MRRNLTVAAAAVAIAIMLSGCSADDGPMQPVPEMGYGGVILDVGQKMTDGFNTVLIDDGVDDVVITKVELDEADPEIEIVGTLLGLQTTYMEQSEKRFPPTEEKLGALVPAIGKVLDAPRTVKSLHGPTKGKMV
ncbi:MAG: hypothetical protein ABWY54_07635, partial [Glaciihabitans sp.]